MSGSTSSRYLVELRERAVRMVAEVRGDHDSEWAAMSKVAELLGSGHLRRSASGSGSPRSMPAPAPGSTQRTRPRYTAPDRWSTAGRASCAWCTCPTAADGDRQVVAREPLHERSAAGAHPAGVGLGQRRRRLVVCRAHVADASARRPRPAGDTVQERRGWARRPGTPRVRVIVKSRRAAADVSWSQVHVGVVRQSHSLVDDLRPGAGPDAADDGTRGG